LGKHDPANRKSPDMKRARMDSGAPKAPKQKLDQSYSDNEAAPSKKLPPKSGSSYKKRGKASAMKSSSNINV